MAKLNHKNLGEVQKTAYLTATITTVDGENDTACFTGIGKCPNSSDIPVFYHCFYEEGEEPAQRSNGALEGAAGAFSEDDEVIVQCKVLDSTTYEPLYVIGFVGKPKNCGFRFRLTRDDGVVIDHFLMGYRGIKIFQTPDFSTVVGSAHGYNPEYPELWTKKGDVWTYLYDDGSEYTYTWSYNEKTQIWAVPFHESFQPTTFGKSFWVTFDCGDSINVQYIIPSDPEVPEYAYKTTDKYKETDLISVGFYEVVVPLFEKTYTHDYTWFEQIPIVGCDEWSGAAGCSGIGGYISSVTKNVIIRSSVDYKIRFRVYDPRVTCYRHHVDPDYWYWWCGKSFVSGSTSNEDSSVDIDSNPINSEAIVTTPYYVIGTKIHSLEFTYGGGYGGYKYYNAANSFDTEIYYD